MAQIQARMLQTYYTLHALAEAWRRELRGSQLIDAFSQVRRELVLAFAQPKAQWMVRLSTGAFRYVFRVEGYHRARRNVATLFAAAHGRTLVDIRVAERDRVLFFELDDASYFQCWLYGPRPNVLWVGPDGRVRAAFAQDDAWRGQLAPAPCPAAAVDTFAAFQARWQPKGRTLTQAVAAAFPLFDALLAQEVIFRAGLEEQLPAECTEEALQRLYAAGSALETALQHPAPRLYRIDPWTTQFALIPLEHLAHLPCESFDSVDAAVHVATRRALAVKAFREAYLPLRQTFETALERLKQQQQMLAAALARPERAEQYARWGHLLMAQAHLVPTGAEMVALPDWFGDGSLVQIPLDPSRSVVENAQAYYERARAARQERETIQKRLEDVQRRLPRLEALRSELEAISSMPALRTFRQRYAAELAALGLAHSTRLQQTEPGFRRIPLGGGYEAWIGRNARENDALTFRYARPFDVWLHARDVPGSHVILRLPGRTHQPPRHVLEQAAALAAYFSKARGSYLVPVVAVPRKYVRKPRAAAPGTVVFEQETVLLVQPQPPEVLQTANF